MLYQEGPLDPIRVYCFMVSQMNNWGLMPGDAFSLKAQLGPEDEHHGPDDFAEAIDRLVNAKLVSRWQHQGSTWLYVVGHAKANRDYLRKLKGEPGIPLPENIEEGGDLTPGANVAPAWRKPGGNLAPAWRQSGAYEGEEEGEEEQKPGASVAPASRQRGATGKDAAPTGSSSKKKGKTKDKPATVEAVRQSQKHHADLFDKDVERELRDCMPLGDLRRRISEAMRVFGGQGDLDAHYGHVKECKDNPKRRNAYRLCYPCLTDGGKECSDRLDRSRFAEMVAVGQQRRKTQQRSERRTKHANRERQAQEEKAAKEAPFDPSKLPAGLRKQYEKARAAQAAKLLPKKKPDDVPDGLPGGDKAPPGKLDD
jgi:hypothetical protein